jgi:hypothetical protein
MQLVAGNIFLQVALLLPQLFSSRRIWFLSQLSLNALQLKFPDRTVFVQCTVMRFK